MFLSYSKLKTFRECRLRYRLQYVNREHYAIVTDPIWRVARGQKRPKSSPFRAIWSCYGRSKTFRNKHVMLPVNRLPRAPRGYARLGQMVHATIRRAYQYASEGKFTREQLQKHYEDVCDVLRQPEVAQSREYRTGRTILENFYRTWESIPARPVLLEQRFKAEIGEHLLTDQFDRVDLREDTGGYEILDYKMGKAILTPAEVEQYWQLGLYGLAFESLQGVVPERMSLVYLRSGEKRRTVPLLRGTGIPRNVGPFKNFGGECQKQTVPGSRPTPGESGTFGIWG